MVSFGRFIDNLNGRHGVMSAILREGTPQFISAETYCGTHGVAPVIRVFR